MRDFAMSKTNKKQYYPNDLIHGLLASHCASVSGKEAGNSKIKAGDAVIMSEDQSLYQAFVD